MTLQEESLFEVPEHWWKRRRCTICKCPLSLEHEYTYVVQRQWWIKVGATNRPRKRLNELARVDWANYCLYPEGMDWTEPLLTLAVVGGDVEHELHQRFVGSHVKGEWFLPSDEIREFLQEVAA